jgi:cytochrome P450
VLRHHPDLDQVLLDREVNRHAAFGLGRHRCPGSNLARMELRVALEEWLARYPSFSLDDPATVVWSGGQIRGRVLRKFVLTVAIATVRTNFLVSTWRTGQHHRGHSHHPGGG